MAEKQINSPLAGTCGRLFDAISAILGLCRVSTYDGEAAVRLSEAMDPCGKPVVAYPYEIRKKEKLEEVDFSVMLKQIAEDCLSGLPSELLIRRFHETLVSALVRMADLAAAQYPKSKRRIVLSGGSMNNPYLSSRLYDRLVDHGFTVYTHHLLPSGDGGLSLGQINIAAQWIKSGAGVLHIGCANFEK
jgi:hydrogenase maturation protein HypF